MENNKYISKYAYSAFIRFKFTYRSFVAILLALGVLVNVFEFSRIDDNSRHNYSALHIYPSGDIFEVAIGHDNSARRRVGPYYYLGSLFPNSTIITPYQGNPASALSLMSLGRADRVIQHPYDPTEILDGLELEPFMVDLRRIAPSRRAAQRVLGENLAIAASSNPSGRFIVATSDEVSLIFIDTQLLDEQIRRELADVE